MDDMSIPNVRDIVYLTKHVGPLRKGQDVIVREVHPEDHPYVITVEANPTLNTHYVKLDMPLTRGEWSDTPVLGAGVVDFPLVRERRRSAGR